jgi:anti-sigma regulatory factor (Ser/Thr protein kinase)
MTTEREWRIQGGDLPSVSAARRDFSRYLEATNAGDNEGRDDSALIFGELVANAVKCARTSVVVVLRENGWTELCVTDDGDCFENALATPQPLYAQSGRGLYIVSRLARDLHVVVVDHHCEVTAVLPIRS